LGIGDSELKLSYEYESFSTRTLNTNQLSLHHPFFSGSTPDPATMPLPKFPLELLLEIAHHIRDDHGELRYDDFNSFVQVNRVLYTCLNCMLWKEAVKHEAVTQHVLLHLIESDNLARLEFFLELGADVDVHLPALEITDLDEWGTYEEKLKAISLSMAAGLDKIPLARLLLEKGAKVQYFDSDRDGKGKFSPLHAAFSAEMVHLLMDHNADPNLEDEMGRLPLHWYAIRNDIEAMRAILLRGAEVNPNTTLRKPLHESAKCDLAAVQLLVEHGADVKDADDDYKATPLHYAAEGGEIEVVRFLVERWPEGIRERKSNGDTALHLAALWQRTEVVTFLLERWPEGIRETNVLGQTPLHITARIGDNETARALVERWPEGVRARDKEMRTPLHWAAGSGEPDVVKFLLERWPAAIRRRDRRGDTPLHLAARKGGPEMVRFLVERWPEGKKVLNNCKDTPLLVFKRSLGIWTTDKQKEEVIALLGGLYSEANGD
jgi:ankyrin repeat protein